MKTKTQFMNRMLSFMLTIVMVLSLVPATVFAAETDTVLYLQPNANWKVDSARFAVYYWNDSGDSHWVDMAYTGDGDIYEVSIPAGYSNIIFCRMNPGNKTNSWDTKWNKTEDLKVPTNGSNLYTVKDDTWDTGGGTWSTYAVTYTVAGVAGLCGTEWDVSNTANDMTKKDPGIYEKVYLGVAAGTYEFKVVQNHSWDNASWPASNYERTVATNNSTVTITFDRVNGKVTAEVCTHTEYEDGKCKVCGVVCTHESYKNGACEECGVVCSHSYADGFCTTCGAKDPMVANPVLDISKGSITVVDGKITQSPEYENQPYSGVLIITGTSKSNTVTVNSGSHKIVLQDCSIKSTSAAAFSIASGATVELTLQNTNTLSSGANHAGLEVPEGATLVINGSGSLTATGGTSAAGIGSGCGANGGTITINSGTVTEGHDFDSLGLCNVCGLRKIWLKASSWEAPTIYCSDTSLEIPMTKDTETGLWYGYVPKTLEGFIFRRLYTNPYSGETFYSRTEQLSLPEDANCYRVKGSPSTDKDETYTYYTYDGNWYLHPCTEHTWESGECSKCGLVCSHTGGEATCTSQAICETCGSGYGEKLAHNFYEGTGKCLECGEFLAVLQETRGGASTYYTLDQIASGKTFGYGGTLTLHANIRMEAGVSLGLGLSDFILDLNGYRLFAVDTHAVKVAGNLTILDSSADGVGYLEGYNIDSRDSTTSAVYGEGNNFHVTVLGDVKLFGVKTFLSGKSSDDVSGGVFDLTQWNHVAGSTIYITHETSTVYDSVLLPTGYALVDTDALVVWPGATVKENKALTVTECTTHAGGTASCAEQAKCEICGASYGELGGHSTTAEGDKAATCKDKAYCSVCKSEYGELDADNHASEEFTYIANEDGTTHKKMHKCCGKTASEAEPHTFDATTGECTACGVKQLPVVTAPVAYVKSIYSWDTNQEYYGLMYCGKEQELVTGGSAQGGTMVYSLDLNGEFTEAVPTAKDAGTYTVYYKVLGDETHADTDVASITVTVEKAPAIMSPTEQTHCMYYDCSDLPTGMRNCDLPNYDGYAIPYPNVDLTYTTNAVQGVKGEYTIFISGPTEDKNYIYTYENGTLILTDHIFNSFTGKCECGEEMAVASTTVDNITIYYLTVQEALNAAAQAESAVVELLRSDENVTGLTMFSGNVRLVMNGLTLKGNVNNNGILQLFGAELTVDGGTIENTAQDGYGVYAAYNDNTHRYSTISIIGSDIIGINAGICTYKADVEVADSTVTGTEYGIHAQKSGAVTLESGTISGKIGVQTSIYGGTLYMGAEGTSSGPTINGQTYGVYHMSHMYAYAGTINCPAGIGVLLSEHHTNQNESEGAGLYLKGLPTINAATDIYVDYSASLRDKRCIQVYVELPEGAYSVDSKNEYEVIAIPGEGIKLNRTWFTPVDENKFVQYNALGYLYLGPCAHGEKRGVQNEDDLTHDIWCDICLTTPEEDVACSGGTATCTSQATCKVCGELYGTKNADNHTGALGTPKPTADGAKHVATWSCCGAIGETRDHTMDAATGKCVCGLEMAVASTTVGGTGTYYETLADAIAAAAVGTEDAPATVMVLKNIDVTETIDVVSGVFTLNLNGKTLRDCKDNGLMDGIFHLPNDSAAYMTIADTEGGKLLADWGAIEIEDGTVTITGGEFNYTEYSLGDAVSIDGGTLNISGGTIYGISAHFGGIVNISGGSISSIHLLEHITVHISGGSIGRLTVDYADNDVKLSGGAFVRIDCRENTVSKLLADGYSYWTQNGTTMRNPAEDLEISGVIVKATCYHPAEKLTYVTCDSSTHTWLCSDCNNNIIEAHTAEPTYAPTADGTKHVATYTCCGGIGETEDHTMDTATGKCVCGLEMAVAKVTSGGVDTHYETLMEALTVAGSGDTVTLCKSVDIGTTRHTIPKGVTFQGGEYTVSSEDASWVENNGTIASGKFTFIVANSGMVLGGEFWTLINSGTVQGGSFESIDCDSGSSLSGPVSITGHLFYGGECTIDLSNATFGDRSFLANRSDSDLTVSNLKLPEGYAVEYDDAVVSVLPAWETGFIVRHTHTYETVFSNTHHWTVCACGKTTAEVEHSYTYSDDGGSTHTVGCTDCTYTDTQSHTYLADTHKCICGNVEKFMVTWTTGDGDNYEKTFKYGETITIPTSEIFQETFRKTGYTLTGWEGYTEGMTMPVDGITFTAIYQVNEYTITFDTDGGSAVAPITQAYGTQIVAPAAPTKDGFHFVKWETLPATVPAGDLTVKAVWEAHYGGTATCTKQAQCGTCGESYGELAEHTPGKAVEENRVESTCTQAGSYEEVVYCSVCQTYEISRTEKTLPLAEHTPGKAVEENRVESTCTQAGSYEEVVYCSVCQTYEISRTEKTLPLAEHTPGKAVEENRVAASCDQAGSYEMVTYCGVCGEELSRRKHTVPATGHHYTAVVTAPNCEDKGYTTYTCACGDTYVADYVAATGHSFGPWQVTRLATCTLKGMVRRDCANCDHYETRQTEPLGHGYLDPLDPSCQICGERREIHVETVAMFRLYNPVTGEHHYTGSTEERDMLVAVGWNYEGVAWNAPVVYGDPVYRYYNPNTGDHHFTMSTEEGENLLKAGWLYEGVAWNSATSEHLPIYRLYNPNAQIGTHHYTGSAEERDNLVAEGWRYEGIAWYALLY